jgi:hypothetical protein
MSRVFKSRGKNPGRIACLLTAAMLIPVAALAADDEQPKKTLPIQVTVDVKWDVDSGGSHNRGSMTMRLRGTANLSEEMSMMDPSAPPGTMITYSADGVGGNFYYSETVTQEHPPEGCPELLAQYEGNGFFTLEKVTSAMTSGLNIRKVGSMVPKEMLQFVPAQAQEMLIDYYDFFAVAKKQTVQGRKRGWNDCNFEEDEKEFSPSQLTIRYRITDDGEMNGRRRWSVERDSGVPDFTIRVSDLPETMERRPLVPEPGGRSDVTYAVNWHFGEVDPYVEIQRKEGEFWVPLLGGDGGQVVVGERMELRGVVHPEEKDPKKGTWSISAEGGSGGETYIKKYKASHKEGEVEHLDSQDLEKSEVLFYWVDEGTGKVEYTTSAGNKGLKESVEFEIKKPQFAFYTEAEPRNFFGMMNRGASNPSDKCCVPTMSEDEQKQRDEIDAECERLENKLASLDPNNALDQTRKKTKLLQEWNELGCSFEGIQYQGISFIAEPQDDIASSGEVQFVQLLSRSIMVESEGGTSYDRIDNVLDGCYPFPKNISYYATLDAPAFTEKGGTSLEVRTLDFEMYLMFRPDGDGNEWVPLKRALWTWAGAIRCDTGTCWEEKGEAVIPTSEQIPDHSEYPEWSACSPSG